MNKEEIADHLAALVKANLVEVRMREDGEWVYIATEYSKTLTPEQVEQILLSSYDEE